MRVVDLDRDMRDVIPTGAGRDSEFLFQRMTDRTLALAEAAPGRRLLDVASGFGQDARALAAQGALVAAAEPSARMSALARGLDVEAMEADVLHLRSWADALPFAAGSFDAVICKGALDHFDAPEQAICEMARVTRPRGRVVLAIANFDSAACHIAHAGDVFRETLLGRVLPRGRRHYDVPHDHFTRYELPLMRLQASAHLHIEVIEGISLAWGLRAWARLVERLPAPVAQGALVGLDALARKLPGLADVVLIAGRPRRSSSKSA